MDAQPVTGRCADAMLEGISRPLQMLHPHANAVPDLPQPAVAVSPPRLLAAGMPLPRRGGRERA
jgi:hypothetical protein